MGRWDHPEEHERASRRMKALWANPEWRSATTQAISDGHRTPESRERASGKSTEYWSSPENREAASEITTALWQDPDYAERTTAAIQVAKASPEERRAQSERSKKMWENPEHRELVLPILAEVNRLPENRRKASQRLKELWANPEHYARMSKLTTDRNLRNWQDPEYRESMFSEGGGLYKAWKAQGNAPNNLEAFFLENCGFPVRYTGDGSYWVVFKSGRRKNPDFKIPGEKTVIELFGDYWHQDDDPQELINLYEEIGYKCYVFWEREVYSLLGDQ